MHELHIAQADTANKAAVYEAILPQIEAIIADEDNLVANLANVAAVLKQAFDWFWVGFYLVDAQRNELVLGPFQGPLACTRIAHGRGVCGQAWANRQTMLVPDVNRHPDHIACSSQSQSEIVVPLMCVKQQGHSQAEPRCWGVLDVDSEHLAHFDATDAQYLEEVAALLVQHHESILSVSI